MHGPTIKLAPALCLLLALGAGCTDSHGTTDSGTRDSGSSTDSAVDDSGSGDAGGEGYYACDSPSDCTITGNTCCGVCGRPTAADVTSVNGERTSDYYDEVACPESGSGEPIGCPDCAQALNPNLIASCSGVGGMCTLVDVENSSAISGCVADTDCIVRVPTCCECGGDTSRHNLIAVSSDGVEDLLTQICDPLADCDLCVPAYPDDVGAVCTDGMCRIEFL